MVKTTGELLAEARVEAMAEVVHEAVRTWQKVNGQPPSPSWSKAPKWMRESTAESVQFTIDNPEAPKTQPSRRFCSIHWSCWALCGASG
ncbi:MAG: hypothetical protein AAFQ18_00705, partial [Pseudomonadota bacterium]